MGILGSFWFAPAWVTQLDALKTHWIVIVYLGLIATDFSTLTQVIGQRHLSASETAIIKFCRSCPGC